MKFRIKKCCTRPDVVIGLMEGSVFLSELRCNAFGLVVRKELTPNGLHNHSYLAYLWNEQVMKCELPEGFEWDEVD